MYKSKMVWSAHLSTTRKIQIIWADKVTGTRSIFFLNCYWFTGFLTWARSSFGRTRSNVPKQSPVRSIYLNWPGTLQVFIMYLSQLGNLQRSIWLRVSLGFERNQKIFCGKKQGGITPKTRFGKTLAYISKSEMYARTRNTHWQPIFYPPPSILK